MEIERNSESHFNQWKNMEIRDFNYFGSQQVADSRNTATNNVTDQDFDLDLQTMNRPPQDGGPMVQGSGHFWCHLTDDCTGDVCISIVVCTAICNEK